MPSLLLPEDVCVKGVCEGLTTVEYTVVSSLISVHSSFHLLSLFSFGKQTENDLVFMNLRGNHSVDSKIHQDEGTKAPPDRPIPGITCRESAGWET